jgi:hypothetical protein
MTRSLYHLLLVSHALWRGTLQDENGLGGPTNFL